MSIDTVKITSWKHLAEQLIAENKPCYLKDANGEYYFGQIIFAGEDKIELECFAPSQKKNKRFLIRWISVIRFDEYRSEYI